MELPNKGSNPTSTAERTSWFANTLLRQRQGGQAIVLLALFMMLLMGLSGIVYDLGFARHEAARVQRAADAAALAGVVFMPEHPTGPPSVPNAHYVAQLTAARHGYPSGQVDTITYGNNVARLGVTISSTYQTAFMGLFGFAQLPMHRTAIAEYNHPIVMGAPEPFLGVGSQVAVTRGGNPPMRWQRHWLSLHSSGIQKGYGDPFMPKWDPENGITCCGGPLQPDFDIYQTGYGYNFGLLTPPGSTGQLQIYDPAYQTKKPDSWVVANRNNGSQRWCADSLQETGDNQPTSAPLNNDQCSTQAGTSGNNAVYTLYYPDTTPWYFEDDVQVGGSSWVVPPVPVTGTLASGTLMPEFAYSSTWQNYYTPTTFGQIAPYNGNYQWRLNARTPFDNNPAVQGTVGQNNFGIRVQTVSAGVRVFAIQRLPITVVLPSGSGTQVADFYLANIGIENAGKVVIVSLFDPGDFSGSNQIQLIDPSDNPVTFHVITHAGAGFTHTPAEFDTDHLDTTRSNPNTTYQDQWVVLLHQLPPVGSYTPGYWHNHYIYTGNGNDRTAWRISIRGNPVHLVLGGGS